MNRFLNLILRYYPIFMGAGFVLIFSAFLIMMKYRQIGVFPTVSWVLAGLGVFFYLVGRVLFFISGRNKRNGNKS